MSRIRVFVPTYRRPRLLERALLSLIAQTHREWRAEVHNDDPTDPQPAALVARLGDPRITCVNHATNWGAIASFNHFYSGEHAANFDYMSLLEDDNAWEPAFLERLLAELITRPEVSLVWCNQSLDREEADGCITPLQQTVHPLQTDRSSTPPELRYFGDPAQAFGAVHANGAMMLRLHPARSYPTPPDLAFTAVESYRERLVSGPLLFIREPLARFTQTQTTSRANEARSWATARCGLISTFVRVAGPAHHDALWDFARTCTPPVANMLILSALADPACRSLLRGATASEIILTLLRAIRHPRINLAALRCRQTSWWPELLSVTAARWRESFPSR